MFADFNLINSNFADGFLLSIEMAVFLDGNGKMGVSSMKMAGFMDTHIKMSLLSIKRPLFVDET